MRTAVGETACTDAHAAIVALRRGEHQVLLAVADLEDHGIARAGDYRSTRRLLEDLTSTRPAPDAWSPTPRCSHPVRP